MQENDPSDLELNLPYLMGQTLLVTDEEVEDEQATLRVAVGCPPEEIIPGMKVYSGSKDDSEPLWEVVSVGTSTANGQTIAEVLLTKPATFKGVEVVPEKPAEDSPETLAGRSVPPDTRPNHQSMLWEEEK